jgi:YVTN family beta-propeller protein
MSFRRVGGLAAVVLSTALWMACGQVYRPVVIPTTTTPPNPANFHAVFAVNSNGSFDPTSQIFSFDVGSALQFDVAGDAVIGATGGIGSSGGHIGVNPTHAAILPNNSRIFVASAGSAEGGADVISAFTPAFDSTIATGLGSVTTFTLPNVVGSSQASSISLLNESGNLVTATLTAPLSNVQAGNVVVVSGAGSAGYDGIFTLSAVSGSTIQYIDSVAGLADASGGTATVSPNFCRYLPDFVSIAQNTTAFVANYGVDADPNCNLASTDSVAVLIPSLNTISNITYLAAGSHPVSLAATPDGTKLYVANQGNNTVSSLNTVDMSQNTVTGFSGATPVWVVARGDSKKVYVLTQGDGQLITLDTATDTVTSSLPVGAGANFLVYDSHLQRLYVTNPATGTLYVFVTSFTDSSGLHDLPQQLAAIPIPGATGCSGCTAPAPVSVTALADGSRAYVASYQLSSCSDPVFSTSCLVIPQVTVIDAASNTIKKTLSALPQGGTTPPSVSESIDCIPSAPYTPGGVQIPATNFLRFSARFRMSTASAADSSRVYVGMCDAGSIAIINTTTSTLTLGNNIPDTLVTDWAAPFGAGFPQATGQPPPQNPIFLLTGQ